MGNVIDLIFYVYYKINLELIESIATIGGIFAIFWQLKLQRKMLSIEIRPFLSVEFIDCDIRLGDGGELLDKNGIPIKELWFRVHNAGRSPATITAMFRRWSIHPAADVPLPSLRQVRPHQVCAKLEIYRLVGPVALQEFGLQSHNFVIKPNSQQVNN